MASGKYELEITGKTTAYLKLQTWNNPVKTTTVTLPDVMGKYLGPFVVFDFDPQGVLVGIEIVGDDDPEDCDTETA